MSTSPPPARPPLATVHVDLDGAKHIYRTHGWRYDVTDDPLFESGLRGALRLFAEADIRATFFVIAEDLLDSRKRDLIWEAARAGHEIASHSLTHLLLTRLDPAGKRREIVDSRKQLIDLLGVDVRGFRAPAFDIDRECLELVSEAGYTYDSSVLPRSKGFRRSTLAKSTRPFRPIDGSPLIELPMPASGRLALPFHPSYSLVVGDRYFEKGLLRFRRQNAELVLLFHLTDFSDRLPGSSLRGWRQHVFTLSYMDADNKRRRCRQMLELTKQHFTVTTTADLIAGIDTLAAK